MFIKNAEQSFCPSVQNMKRKIAIKKEKMVSYLIKTSISLYIWSKTHMFSNKEKRLGRLE